MISIFVRSTHSLRFWPEIMLQEQILQEQLLQEQLLQEHE